MNIFKKILKFFQNLFFEKENYRLIKRASMFVITSMAMFAVFSVLDLFPKAEAKILTADEFKSIAGCWYSLTPSSTGNSVKTSEGGQTKYCYTLEDENSSIQDRTNYQYIVDDTDEVYVFEYYTYIDDGLTSTQQIAVYSDTGLTKHVNTYGEEYYTNKDDGYAYKTIDDYLYYRLYQFIPDWKPNGTVRYDKSAVLGFDDNSYYGYELTDTDIYEQYYNIDVNTEYVMDFTDSQAIFYKNMHIDDDGNIVAGNGKTDASEYQIINRNDINQRTFIIEAVGDAYVYADVNGKVKGEEGFSTNLYYKGGALYVWETFETDTVNGKTTISAFKVYKMLTDSKEVEEATFNSNTSDYSLITFNDKNEMIEEAIRYYNLYEITYSTSQSSSNQTITNKTEATINSQVTTNKEFSYSNSGNPTLYDIKYDYSFTYRDGYLYKITYQRYVYRYKETSYSRTDTTNFNVEANGRTEKILVGQTPSKSSGYGGIEKLDNLTKDNVVSKYNSNIEFYTAGSAYEDTSERVYTYTIPSGKSGTFSNVNKTVTSYYESNEKVDNTTGGSTSTKTYTSYDANGKASTVQANYSYGGSYFTGRTRTGYEQKVGGYEQKVVGYEQKYSHTNYTYYRVKLKVTKMYSDASTGAWNYDTSKSFNLSFGGSGSGTFTLRKTANDYSKIVINEISQHQNGNTHNHSDGDKPDTSNSGNNERNFKYLLSSDISNQTDGTKGCYASSNDLIYTSDKSSWGTDSSKWLPYVRITAGASSSSAYYYHCTGFSDSCGWFGNQYDFNWERVYIKSAYQSYYGYTNYSYEMSSGNTQTATSKPYYANNSTVNVTKEGAYYYDKILSQTDIYVDDISRPIYADDTTKPIYVDDTSKPIYTYTGKILSESKTYTLVAPSTTFTVNSYSWGHTPSIAEVQEWADGEVKRYTGISDIVELSNTSTLTKRGAVKQMFLFTNNVGYYELSKSGNNFVSIKFYFIPYYTGDSSLYTAKFGDVATSISSTLSTSSLNVSTSYKAGNNYQNYTFYKITSSKTNGTLTSTSSGWKYNYSDPGTSKTNENTSLGTVTGSVSNGFTRKDTYTYKQNTEKSLIAGAIGSDSKTVDLYSNTSGQNKSGNYYSLYDSNGKNVKLAIQGTGASLNYAGCYWGYVSSADNTDVDLKWTTSSTYSQTNTTDYSETSNNQAYWLTHLKSMLTANGKTYDASKVVGHSTSTSIAEKYYSGTLTTYSFTGGETKAVYNYGKNSSNFGSSNVTDKGYYSNLTYDSNGRRTNGTWNSTNLVSTPESYNLFNQATFFKNYSKNNYLRVSGDSYTVKNSVSINIRDYISNCSTASTLTTYYFTYKINGTKYSKTFSNVNKNTANDSLLTLKINLPNGSSSMVLSEMMLSRTSNANYTKFASIGYNNYYENIIAHLKQATTEWHQTEKRATSLITNLNQLIDKNGNWNNNVDVVYGFTLDGKTYTYKNNNSYPETILTTVNGKPATRMVYLTGSQNTQFAYKINKQINYKESKLGNDFYNITENEQNKAKTFYNNNVLNATHLANNKNATIIIGGAHFNNNNYISKDEIYGKIALISEYGELTNNLELRDLDNYYIKYNKSTGVYSIIKVNQVVYYKYDVYYDARKTTKDGGTTFTYNADGYQNLVDKDGNALKSKVTTFETTNGLKHAVTKEEYRTSAIYNNKFVNGEDILLTPTTSSSPALYKENFITNLNIKDITLKDGNELTNTNYNNYTVNYFNENEGNLFLMLASSTVDNGKGVYDNDNNLITSDKYVNAYYKDNNNNSYRLKYITDSNVLYSATGALFDSIRHKVLEKFILEGHWYSTDDLQSLGKTRDNPEYDNFLSDRYKLYPNLEDSVYLSRVKASSELFPNKLIGQDIGLYVTESSFYYDDVHNQHYGDTTNYMDLYNKKIADYLISNKTDKYKFESGKEVTMREVLVKRDKAYLYKLAKKTPQVLQYYLEDDTTMASIDMRYQYSQLEETIDTSKPVIIYGDDLQNVFKIQNATFTDANNNTVEGLEAYNLVISTNPYQAGLKNGVLTIEGYNGNSDVKEFAETLYYNDKVYKLGNIQGTFNSQKLDNFAKLTRYFEENLKSLLDGVNSNSIADIITAIGNEKSSIPVLKSTIFSAVYDAKEKKVQVDTTYDSLMSKLERSSNYIRVGDAIYYEYCNFEDYYSFRGIDVNVDCGDSSSNSPEWRNWYEKTKGSVSNVMTNIVAGVGAGGVIGGPVGMVVGAIGGAGKAVVGEVSNYITLSTIAGATGSTNPYNDLAYVTFSGLVNNGMFNDKIKQEYSSAEVKFDVAGVKYLMQPNTDNKSKLDIAYNEYLIAKGKYESAELMNNSSYVCLKDIITKSSKINQYFVEVLPGGSQSFNDFITFLPTANVTYTKSKYAWDGNDSKPEIDNEFKATGVHLYNLSAANFNSKRFIVSDIYDIMIVYAGTAWYDRVGVWNGDINEVNIVFTDNDNADISDRQQNLFDRVENLWNGNGMVMGMTVWDSITIGKGAYRIEDSKTGITYYQKLRKGTMPLVSNEGFWQSVANITDTLGSIIHNTQKVLKTAFSNAFTWFASWFGVDMEYADFPNLIESQYTFITFAQYNKPKDDNLADTFSIETSTIENGKLVDNDYSLKTSFSLTINNKTNIKDWGYWLYYTNGPLENGYRNDAGFRTLIDSETISHVDSINVILQSDINDRSVTITNLPAGRNYTLIIYSNPFRKITTSKVTSETEGIKINETGAVMFSTDVNLVHNPYGNTLANEEMACNGDKELKKEYIDVEIQRMLFDVRSANCMDDKVYISGEESFSKANDNYLVHSVTGVAYTFSKKYLMKKYLNTDNISKIAFFIREENIEDKGKGVNTTLNKSYKIYDKTTGKYQTGKIAGGEGNSNIGAIDNRGIIYYELTDADKRILVSNYNNIIDENYVNNYLLNNKLEFYLENGIPTSYQGNYKYKLLWQPYFEDTKGYLDYNQNGQYDGYNDVRINENNYYDINSVATSSENPNLKQASFSHILSYGNDARNINFKNANWKDNTNWKEAYITTTFENGKTIINNTFVIGNPVNDYYQLSNWLDGEAHIYQ